MALVVMNFLKQTAHWPSFLWGAGMISAAFGVATLNVATIVGGMMIYILGHILMRWQPHY